MKKCVALFICILMSASIFSQSNVSEDPDFKFTKLLHVGMNYTPNTSKVQMQLYASSSYPWLQHKKMIFSSEARYLGKCKGSDLSGLKFQPINTHYVLADNYLSRLLVGSDFGYLVNRRKGLDNGFVITPNLKYELAIIDLKCGYDFDITNKVGQFNITASVSVSGLGMLMYLITKYNN